jgi:hypothetical protein
LAVWIPFVRGALRIESAQHVMRQSLGRPGRRARNDDLRAWLAELPHDLSRMMHDPA